MESGTSPFNFHTRRQPYTRDDVDDFPDTLEQDEPEHDDDDIKHRRPHIPPIPDLRFENSYLRSLRNCLEIQHHSRETAFASAYGRGPPPRPIGEGSEEYEKIDSHPKHPSSEGGIEVITVQVAEPTAVTVAQQPTFTVIHVDWKTVAWITTKDQVIMPFLQGMVWGVAGTYITPLLKRLFGRRTQGLSLKERARQTAASDKLREKLGSLSDGEGAQRLRSFAKGLGISS